MNMNIPPNSFLQIQTHTSSPIRINHTELRLRSQVVQVRLPIASGGLIWNRPVSVMVRISDGEERQLPVQDPTRLVILLLLGICLLSLFRLILPGPKNFVS